MTDRLAIQSDEDIPALAYVIWWGNQEYTGGAGIEGDVYESKGAALAAAFVLDRYDRRFQIIPYEVEHE